MDKVMPVHVAGGRFLASRRAKLLVFSLVPLLVVLLALLVLPLPSSVEEEVDIVRRRVAEMMDELEASSRFQAGVEAVLLSGT